METSSRSAAYWGAQNEFAFVTYDRSGIRPRHNAVISRHRSLQSRSNW